MSDFLFRGSLADLDPDVFELSQLESERQYRRLILIPSESTAPMAVRQALASAFHNVYAEGYPDESSRWMEEPEILDLAQQLAHYRRYSDPRYYKGVEYVDVVEALARRRCAEAFAANGVEADDLYVNVQPLSGAPANNAVYHALVEPGATVLGMNLMHGGHLTHGSPVNRSGKYYNAVHYTVDPENERIDYDQVAELAEQHQPKLIIAGYSSYPWTVDWARFRQIADAVGAYLLADIAHVAGLVVAGEYPSPIGHAHVVTFTTHKSLCGPRGAAIVTAERSLSRKIDRAVFPGEQGGPHINAIAAQAVTFKLAMTESFSQLQRAIVRNCAALTEAIAAEGLRIPFGGTDTHLTNVDCSSVVGQDGTPLSGDMAARILDLMGIVCNRNTIPGDTSALNPSGIRLGTPWISQRGFGEDDCRQLGRIIGQALQACRPYAQPRRSRDLARAKIPHDRLHTLAEEVRQMAESAGIDFEPTAHGYPHFAGVDHMEAAEGWVQLSLRGGAAADMIRWATTVDPDQMALGKPVTGDLRGPWGTEEIVVERADGEWRMFVAGAGAAEAAAWLRDLSDGFVVFDEQDLQRKLPGPVVVRWASRKDAPPAASSEHAGEHKPWFIGVSAAAEGEPKPAFEWQPTSEEGLRRTALAETHAEHGAKMVPFAGWEMPVWYSSVLEEHRAVREAAGLFDVSHMGVYAVEGDGAADFLDCVVANDVSALAVGRSHYTHMLLPDGSVLDDLMVYRRPSGYLLVVNAANDDKNWAWLQSVHAGEVQIDGERPWSLAFGRGCRLQNLRLPEAGKARRVDVALQGPASQHVLLELGCAPAVAEALKRLPWAGLMQAEFGGFDLIVSRTGYTGERIAYELFVHPDHSPALWQALLQAGEPLGLRPAGLGARDSLRTEAGLPLYGQELAGGLELGIGDAGFIGYAKTYKPWFVGRAALLAAEATRTGEIARFRFDDRGVRMAHYGDPVVDRRGLVIGQVTSCAADGEGRLLGQAYLGRDHLRPGTPIGVFSGGYRSRESIQVGQRVGIPTPATVIDRFPK